MDCSICDHNYRGGYAMASDSLNCTYISHKLVRLGLKGFWTVFFTFWILVVLGAIFFGGSY